MTLEFSKYDDSEIKPGDYVINDKMQILQVNSTEPRDNGNIKYWFTNGKFGLKDETLLGCPNSFYVKVDGSKLK